MATYWLKYGNNVLSRSGSNIGTEYDPQTVVIGGKPYPTVTMPNGKTWLARNLDLTWDGLSVNPQHLYDEGAVAAYYDRDESTYGWDGLQYGLLYNKAANEYLVNNSSTLFPGWHIATSAEIENLYTSVGGTWNPRTGAQELTTTTGWSDGYNGNDTYGFSLPPAGYAETLTNGFVGLGGFARLWTSSYMQGYSTWGSYYVRQNGLYESGTTVGNDIWMKSIRLVKNSA